MLEAVQDKVKELSFNSMKVRLKLGLALSLMYYNMTFQFHEGPIKTKGLQ